MAKKAAKSPAEAKPSRARAKKRGARVDARESEERRAFRLMWKHADDGDPEDDQTKIARANRENLRFLIRVAVAIGLTQDQIARQINYPDGIKASTLALFFREELDDGGTRLMTQIAGNMARMALAQGDNRSALDAGKFLLTSRFGKTFAAQSASVSASVKGGDGAPAGDMEVTFKIQGKLHGAGDESND
jgi:hypothetical protein